MNNRDLYAVKTFRPTKPAPMPANDRGARRPPALGRPGTSGICCRPSSAGESPRAADIATGNRSEEGRRSRSSPPAYPSRAADLLVSPPGSTAQAAPIARPSGRSATRRPTADKSPDAPASTLRSKPPRRREGCEISSTLPEPGLLGQALSSKDDGRTVARGADFRLDESAVLELARTPAARR